MRLDLYPCRVWWLVGVSKIVALFSLFNIPVRLRCMLCTRWSCPLVLYRPSIFRLVLGGGISQLSSLSSWIWWIVPFGNLKDKRRLAQCLSINPVMLVSVKSCQQLVWTCRHHEGDDQGSYETGLVNPIFVKIGFILNAEVVRWKSSFGFRYFNHKYYSEFSEYSEFSYWWQNWNCCKESWEVKVWYISL